MTETIQTTDLNVSRTHGPGHSLIYQTLYWFSLLGVGSLAVVDGQGTALQAPL